jgi:1,2-diacylglycerol 3-alpha-glucosyltransferase
LQKSGRLSGLWHKFSFVSAINHFLPENMRPYVPLISSTSWGCKILDKILWQMVLDVFRHLNIATAPSVTAAGILRRQGLQIPVRPISCGVDLQWYRPNPTLVLTAARQKFHLSMLGWIFLYLGRLDLERRVDVLIRAWSLLKRTDIQLAIAGTGNQERRLKKMVNDLGLEKQVNFLGYVPEEDIPVLLNCVDYFTMPSDAELLSIATLEAMASGRPALAADARALSELVEQGVNGCLFSPNDPRDAAHCVERLVTHPMEWKSMSAASLKTAREHRLSKTMDQYADLYREVYQTAQKERNASHPGGRRDQSSHRLGTSL